MSNNSNSDTYLHDSKPKEHEEKIPSEGSLAQPESKDIESPDQPLVNSENEPVESDKLLGKGSQMNDLIDSRSLLDTGSKDIEHKKPFVIDPELSLSYLVSPSLLAIERLENIKNVDTRMIEVYRGISQYRNLDELRLQIKRYFIFKEVLAENEREVTDILIASLIRLANFPSKYAEVESDSASEEYIHRTNEAFKGIEEMAKSHFEDELDKMEFIVATAQYSYAVWLQICEKLRSAKKDND